MVQPAKKPCNYIIFQHRFLHLIHKVLVYGLPKGLHETNGNTVKGHIKVYKMLLMWCFI